MHASPSATSSDLSALTPSASQRAAIEAAPGPLLVLAGPGAGKTFCLTERIRFLVEELGVQPARICAFTFTNKAAGEIAHRLESRLGERAAHIKRGTIHAFCADLLRAHGAAVGLAPGFGIADEEYQLSVLRRIEGPRRWHRAVLNRFAAFRFRDDSLQHNDLVLFDAYEKYLAKRNVLDFDQLVIRAAALLEMPEHAAGIRSAWDVILVDEFQDLNPVQYRVVRALAAEHRHVFGVGDDEQSIYSWAGADPRVFTAFTNDFHVTPIHLEENRRCPHEVFALARRLVTINTPIFENRIVPRAERPTDFDIRAVTFANDDDEAAWLVNDVRCDREEHGHAWGDVALLYRKHDIGERLESAFLKAGIPCRLPPGRAIAEDPIVAYVIAAVRAIENPQDDIIRDDFLRTVLPRPLYDEALAKADESRIPLHHQLNRMAASLPRADETARQIRRAMADWRNLIAVGRQHESLGSLITELLSRRVGPVRSVLDEHHDDLRDPAELPDVVALAERLRDARERGVPVWIEPMEGLDIPLLGMLRAVRVDAVRSAEPPADAVHVRFTDVTSVGMALGVFKACQLLETGDIPSSFTDFTAIDLETTDRRIANAEAIEIGAVRVRDGAIVDQKHWMVKPRGPITAGARAAHGITDDELIGARRFEEVWPEVRAFCGADVVVAHNGYDFDFPVLRRQAKEANAPFDLCTFDSLPLSRDLFATSRKLGDLARQLGIPTGTAHRALDDTLTLAKVLVAMGRMKLARARKTALVNLLDLVGVALALEHAGDATGTDERQMIWRVARAYALGPYSDVLDWYERQQAGNESIPSVDELIERLGGRERMEKLRTIKSAEERYPAAMGRLRRLIVDLAGKPYEEQRAAFLERVALSRLDGFDVERECVNLLTLHSTKGLEFSRVYIVGAEDAELPGERPDKPASVRELEEARRLLYVGMTRTVDRLTLTRVESRAGKPTGGHRFLTEMGLQPMAAGDSR